MLNKLKHQPSDGREYLSCKFLEYGLSFSYSSLRACAEIHHGTGEPELYKYTGGPLSLDRIVAAKANIIYQNQKKGHANCIRCPSLMSRHWPKSDYPIRWLGLTHWIGCNLKCNYCWLQWAEWSPKNSASKIPPRLYAVVDAVCQLIDEGWLAPDAIIDWGGGGEPTLIPEFNEVLILLDVHGTTQWMHTNGTILPRAIRQGLVDGNRIHVLCSVDAGSAKTYRKLKRKNCYEIVWRNLQAYDSAGAHVTAKYLMVSENCSIREIGRFVRDAVRFGRPAILGDIDHRHPDPKPEIIKGLAHLKCMAEAAYLNYSCGETGVDSAPEFKVPTRVEETSQQLVRHPYFKLQRYLMKIQRYLMEKGI